MLLPTPRSTISGIACASNSYGKTRCRRTSLHMLARFVRIRAFLATPTIHTSRVTGSQMTLWSTGRTVSIESAL
eukprot:5538903-Pyramimonas_sp.AAC.1